MRASCPRSPPSASSAFWAFAYSRRPLPTSPFRLARGPEQRRGVLPLRRDIAGEEGRALPSLCRRYRPARWGEQSAREVCDRQPRGRLFRRFYAHCSAVTVARRGRASKKGDELAHVGSTGNATGPHLHFEVHDGGEYLNPIYYVVFVSLSGACTPRGAFFLLVLLAAVISRRRSSYLCCWPRLCTRCGHLLRAYRVRVEGCGARRSARCMREAPAGSRAGLIVTLAGCGMNIFLRRAAGASGAAPFMGKELRACGRAHPCSRRSTCCPSRRSTARRALSQRRSSSAPLAGERMLRSRDMLVGARERGGWRHSGTGGGGAPSSCSRPCAAFRRGAAIGRKNAGRV